MIPKTPGIYKIVHVASKRAYVGSAANLANRWAVHRHGLSRGKHHSIKLQRAWNKYGAEAFAFVVVEIVHDKERLIEREQFWINATRCALVGFNVAPIAGSTLGRRFSDETRQKMSAARKGRTHTGASKAKMSAARKGVKFSDEHRARISAANVGKVIPVSARSKMSAAAKARVARSARRKDGRFGAEHDIEWSDPTLERSAA